MEANIDGLEYKLGNSADEIVCLIDCNGDNPQQTCRMHERCGTTLKIDDIIVFRDTSIVSQINDHTEIEMSTLRAIRKEKGKGETCTVGYVNKEHIGVFNLTRLSGKVARVIRNYSLESPEHERASRKYNGVFAVIVPKSDETRRKSFPKDIIQPIYTTFRSSSLPESFQETSKNQPNNCQHNKGSVGNSSMELDETKLVNSGYTSWKVQNGQKEEVHSEEMETTGLIEKFSNDLKEGDQKVNEIVLSEGNSQWKNVWPRLEKMGWTMKKFDGKEEYVYLPRDGNFLNGKEGVDFFTTINSVLNYVKSNKLFQKSTDQKKETRNGKRKSLASTTTQSTEEGNRVDGNDLRQKSHSLKNQERKIFKGNSNSSSSSSKARKKNGKEKKRCKLSWDEIYPRLQKEGWTISRLADGGKDVYFIPGAEKKINKTLGEDYFFDVNEALEYANKQEHQFSANEGNLECLESCVSDSQDDKNDYLCESEYTWGNLWPRLKKIGWTYQKAPPSSLVDYFYLKKDASVKHGVRGIDYFGGEIEALEFALENRLFLPGNPSSTKPNTVLSGVRRRVSRYKNGADFRFVNGYYRVIDKDAVCIRSAPSYVYRTRYFLKCGDYFHVMDVDVPSTGKVFLNIGAYGNIRGYIPAYDESGKMMVEYVGARLPPGKSIVQFRMPGGDSKKFATPAIKKTEHKNKVNKSQRRLKYGVDANNVTHSKFMKDTPKDEFSVFDEKKEHQSLLSQEVDIHRELEDITWHTLRTFGWTYKPGDLRSTWIYIPPGVKYVKDKSVLDKDYFLSEKDAVKFAIENSMCQSQTKVSEQKGGEPVDISMELWEKLKLESWTYQKNEITGKIVYVTPTGIYRDGVEIEDYFTNESDIRTYLACRSSKNKMEKVSMNHPSDPANTCNTSSRKDSVEYESPPAVSEEEDVITWKYLLKECGWSYKSGGLLSTWSYIPPGVHYIKGKSILGKDYFDSEEAAVFYAIENGLCIPIKRNSLSKKKHTVSRGVEQKDLPSELWTKLVEKGWSYQNDQVNQRFLYVAPNGVLQDGTEGVDYFTDAKDVMLHVHGEKSSSRSAPLPPLLRRVHVDEENRENSDPNLKGKDKLEKVVELPDQGVSMNALSLKNTFEEEEQVESSSSCNLSSGVSLEQKIAEVQKIFDKSMIPHRLIEREKEFFRLQEFFKEAFRTRQCTSIHIAGKPGTGKTLVVNKLCEKLDALYKETCPDSTSKLNILQLNVQSIHEPKQLYKSLASSFFFNHYDSDQVLGYLDSEFSRHSKTTFVIILDEIDHLLQKPAHQREMISLFTWAKCKRNIILIGISNSVGLNGTIWQTLSENQCAPMEIVFDTYDYHALCDILRDRLGKNRDLFDQSAIDLIARKIAKSHGDARVALDVCTLALTESMKENKMDKGLPLVNAIAVAHAWKKTNTSFVNTIRKHLNRNAKIALLAAARTSGQSGVFSMSQLYEEFKKQCAIGGCALLPHTLDFQNYIQQLDSCGLATYAGKKSTSDVGKHQIKMHVKSDLILKALENDDDEYVRLIVGSTR